jgi:sodium transport system permease protein
LDEQDVADKSHRDAAMWSKILPFLLLIWALTGAFYPAVDLCAGEKERGTLETLLISPAERSEIVWGKLFTVMLFSVATAVLNLASMGLSAAMILSSIPNLGPPPPLAPLWLLLALLPVAALFSALCLALAAFAKSSKEGQYYLMPVLLVSMPLMMLPMAPGVELSLGNSLIPITGVVLLLRAMLEGNYWQALPYVPVVVGVTMACCLFAVRWAIDQFNSESVLFRESERLDIGLWLRQVLRDREDTPSAAAAILCCMLILMVQYFLNFAIGRMQAGADPGELNLLRVVLVSQLVAILTPALLMTLFAARSPRKTLLLRLPRLSSLPAVALLAVALFPSAMVLNTVIQRLYPISESVQQALQALQTVDYPWWVALGLFALTPAICEELAFRGFVLSGFRHLGHKWRAIALSAFFFGITHSILQQSISACVLGLVIGYIAVQTSSILPGMTFHFTHNALGTLGIGWLIKAAQEHPQTFGWLLRGEALQESVAGSATPPEFIFTWPVVVASALVAVLLLGWLHRLPYAKTAEEALQDARDHELLPTVEYEV